MYFFLWLAFLTELGIYVMYPCCLRSCDLFLFVDHSPVDVWYHVQVLVYYVLNLLWTFDTTFDEHMHPFILRIYLWVELLGHRVWVFPSA